MILDTLKHAKDYSALHPCFDRAFRFLTQPGLDQLADGRHEIDGDRIYAVVMRKKGVGKKAAKLEAHRRYIDIQYTVRGEDTIGWADLESCAKRDDGYLTDKDLELCQDRPWCWVSTPAGTFAMFFPADAHAPMGTTREVHKVVVKVAV